jgi:uncharacterized membrane protein YeaQ/YmgE (transglycosylase-associated protein family)
VLCFYLLSVFRVVFVAYSTAQLRAAVFVSLCAAVVGAVAGGALLDRWQRSRRAGCAFGVTIVVGAVLLAAAVGALALMQAGESDAEKRKDESALQAARVLLFVGTACSCTMMVATGLSGGVIHFV